MLFEIVLESSQEVLFGQYFHKYFFSVHMLYYINFCSGCFKEPEKPPAGVSEDPQ